MKKTNVLPIAITGLSTNKQSHSYNNSGIYKSSITY